METEDLFFKRKIVEDAPLGIIFKYGTDLYNPLANIPEEFEDKPELYLTYVMSRPEYFWMACKSIFNIELYPFQGVILQELWNHKFPMLVGSRGLGKSFCLALYGLLRALFIPNRKILICSAGFRQAKIIFNYMENIIADSPIFKDMMITDGGTNKAPEGWELKIGNSSIRAIPLGDGSRIRGLRANDILSDEFDSIPLEVFETVVAGFASVSASPAANAARIARNKMREYLGIIEEEEETGNIGNQIILSGTAGYSFKHFAKYHERYLKIIRSRGEPDRLKEVFGDEAPPRGFNHRDFSVIRMPVDLLPQGFMDDSQIARAKATVHSGIYQMEYCAVFSSDSNGFFPRSIIEKCTVKDGESITIKNITIPAEEIVFKPRLYGNPELEYVMGIDPAMSSDNFAIVMLEIHGTHRRVVYCWTTNEADYKTKKRKGLTTCDNYYSFCVRKIRELYRDFNVVAIALDKEGGGRAILEGMNSEQNIKDGEDKLLPVWLPNKKQDSDYEEGLHIIDVVNFSKEDYTSQSNHGMRKDMEENELLFPLFDPIVIAEIDINKSLTDKNGNLYNANESAEETVMLEIEELKDELCTIVVTATATTGRERFDTPEVKTSTGKKGRMRKDRYSALLMANMTARLRLLANDVDMVSSEGGFAHTLKRPKFAEEKNNSMYTGPDWLVKQFTDLYG